VTLSIQQLRKRTSKRLDKLKAKIDPAAAAALSNGKRVGSNLPAVSLLSNQLRWLYGERLDLHATIDLDRLEHEARLLDWSVKQMPTEYNVAPGNMDWEHLAGPCGLASGAFSSLVSRLMMKNLLLKPKLKDRFDVGTRYGRATFIEWYLREGLFADEVDDTPYVDQLINALSASARRDESELPINRFAAVLARCHKSRLKGAEEEGLESFEEQLTSMVNAEIPELLYIYNRLPDGVRPVNSGLSLQRVMRQPPQQEQSLPKGANLVGYAHGAFGMGEHVRMVARALSVWTDNFTIIDVDAYAHERQPEADIGAWSRRPERYRTNVFHVNADAMAGALTSVGPVLGRDRYNIGYWAWELSRVPEDWHPSIDFVDEIWAPSRFIQDAFQDATEKPVIHMPLCVDLAFGTWHRRSHFDLPRDKFLFLYYFDSYSYFERKNPLAALRAFISAFPTRDDVGLVIKTQNARGTSPEWLALQAMAESDPRIHVLNRVMSKGEVLSLQAECDCFVSLHRSEGFGRGPAEAMWLGKPVIVTAYGGNMDFTLPENALLVDYELIKVRGGEYPFFHRQVWASPDEEHAARQMRRVVNEPGLAQELGRRGAALMRDQYSAHAVGRHYFNRLREIGAL